MAYTKTVWEDLPSEDTPIVSTALNNIENGIEALDIAYSGLLNFFYPVGTIYETTSTDLDTTTKMAAHFGGTWEVYASGRVLVAKSADTEFDTIGKMGGDKTHTLTIAEMPNHDHLVSPKMASGNGDTTSEVNYLTPSWANIQHFSDWKTGANGGDQPHNNLQPYIVVYRYRRTA